MHHNLHWCQDVTSFKCMVKYLNRKNGKLLVMTPDLEGFFSKHMLYMCFH